jgi:transposase-like protein
MSSQQLETLEILCPFCKDITVVKHGLDNSQTKQRFLCRSCGRNFFVSLTEAQIIIPQKRGKTPKAMSTISPTVVCPNCQSVNLRKNGKVSGNRQRYFCKDCQRDFRYPPIETVHTTMQIRKETAKTKMASNRVMHVARLGVDSVNDIPCFVSCELRDCSPVSCEKLSKWLDCPAIHVKEIKYSTYPDDFVKGDD